MKYKQYKMKKFSVLVKFIVTTIIFTLAGVIHAPL